MQNPQEDRNVVTLSPVQSRMARAAVSFGVRELAAAASVSPDTVARLERGEVLQTRTVIAIRQALEAAGVDFIEENGGGPGVRLMQPLARFRDGGDQAIRFTVPLDVGEEADSKIEVAFCIPADAAAALQPRVGPGTPARTVFERNRRRITVAAVNLFETLTSDGTARLSSRNMSDGIRMEPGDI